MKLFVVNSCFLVLLMAALGKASVLDSGLEDDERIQLRWDCSGTGNCDTPCGNSVVNGGTCFGGKCCPKACITGVAPNQARVTCVKGSSCLDKDCAAAPGDKCCLPCTDDTSCSGKCTGCDPATQTCKCNSETPKSCECVTTCVPAQCTAPVGGICGTTNCGKGVKACQCTAGVCSCGPCDTDQCKTDCNAANTGDTGTCGATGCVCSTPPVTNPCTSQCETTITFNIETCGVNGAPCP